MLTGSFVTLLTVLPLIIEAHITSMENSTNETQRTGGYGVLLEPSWAYAGVGVYSAIVFLIVTGLYVAFDG